MRLRDELELLLVVQETDALDPIIVLFHHSADFVIEPEHHSSAETELDFPDINLSLFNFVGWWLDLADEELDALLKQDRLVLRPVIRRGTHEFPYTFPSLRVNVEDHTFFVAIF